MTDTEPAGDLASIDLQAAAGVAYRVIDYWCRRGLLGPDQIIGPGKGANRRFTTGDLAVAAAIGQISRALERIGARGSMALYRQVADQVRAGDTIVGIDLGEGVHITIYHEPNPRSHTEISATTPDGTGG